MRWRQMEKWAQTIMLQGTASDVGKSVLATAFCRIFVQDGYRTAPFKSQNMSLNTHITPDGCEIGSAQGMQADACRIAATTDMNPILLKPVKDMASQVFVHGKPYKLMDARAYREQYLDEAKQIVVEALSRLRKQYDRIVIEGAGSPAEINLKDRDIVNMRLAAWADAPVILAADIDRGGVFASIVGTLEILTPEERARVKGFIINKFRGDVSLLKPGLDWLEQKTGKPVLGVVPYLPSLGLEDEDSASLDRSRFISRSNDDGQNERLLDIAVIRLPRMAQFSDMDPFMHEPDVYVRYIEESRSWGAPDAVIVPGTNQIEEAASFLHESGLADRIEQFARNEGAVIGIGAGFQLMGTFTQAAGGKEIRTEMPPGLALLPMETALGKEEKIERVFGSVRLPGIEETAISGYVRHSGKTVYSGQARSPFVISCYDSNGDVIEREDGMTDESGRIWGTSVHGIFHNDEFRRQWLNQLRTAKGWAPIRQTILWNEQREAAFDRLADHVRKHVRMDWIEEIMRSNGG